MKRLAAACTVVVMAGTLTGCGLGPRNFRKITHPAPLIRARAISLGRGKPDSVVFPALLARMNDPDVVVRLAANEELKQRTGRDLGFVPWAGAAEREQAIGRWRAWLYGGPVSGGPQPARPRKSLPRPSPQERPAGPAGGPRP